MQLRRRDVLQLAAGAATTAVASGRARAQSYPARPVQIVVGFPAGSGPDIVARLAAQWLTEQLGQQFVVDNRPGAGSNLATEAAARAAPDGYTMLMTVATNTVNATLYDNLKFDFLRDIAPSKRTDAYFASEMVLLLARNRLVEAALRSPLSRALGQQMLMPEFFGF